MIADAARWSLAQSTVSNPTFGQGKAPRMIYMPWRRSQTTELGATAKDAWYRRCLTRGCRRWAGPYANPLDAKEDGTWHQYHAHDAVIAP